MIKHLEESTNEIKNRQKFAKMILVITYLLIWAVSICFFWLGGRYDAMGYSLIIFLLVLPVTSLILSIFIGNDDSFANYKWLMLLFFGVMYMLARSATFDLANSLANNKINLPELTSMLPGILFSAAGLTIGMIISIMRKKKTIG